MYWTPFLNGSLRVHCDESPIHLFEYMDTLNNIDQKLGHKQRDYSRDGLSLYLLKERQEEPSVRLVLEVMKQVSLRVYLFRRVSNVSLECILRSAFTFCLACLTAALLLFSSCTASFFFLFFVSSCLNTRFFAVRIVVPVWTL